MISFAPGLIIRLLFTSCPPLGPFPPSNSPSYQTALYVIISVGSVPVNKIFPSIIVNPTIEYWPLFIVTVLLSIIIWSLSPGTPDGDHILGVLY